MKENARYPIPVTLFGRTTEVKRVPSKAFSPISAKQLLGEKVNVLRRDPVKAK
jgi:hypothetical protein